MAQICDICGFSAHRVFFARIAAFALACLNVPLALSRWHGLEAKLLSFYHYKERSWNRLKTNKAR
jgi:hypothetical protein